MIKVTQQHPQYGVNYGPGWIGFICRRHEFIAAGIDWFERWDTITKLPLGPASHTFNLANDTTTIEAFENGVWRGNLLEYLQDPDVALLVRKPRNLMDYLAAQIVATAQIHIGEAYNNKLIAALAADNTFLGHLFGQRYRRWLCKRADASNRWICSKLVGTSLQQRELIALGGVLLLPPYFMMPVDLFEDIKIFEEGAVELVPDDHPLDQKS